MQQRGGVDEFYRGSQLVMPVPLIPYQMRARERQHRTQSFAAAGNQMSGQCGDQRDFALHPVDDHGVHRIHARSSQPQHRIERGVFSQAATGLLARKGDDLCSHNWCAIIVPCDMGAVNSLGKLGFRLRAVISGQG